MIDLSLLQDFIDEAEEHLNDMETNLLRLEADTDDKESLNDVFRSVHSIKGSAEYIGTENIAKLTHKLENLLEMLRQGERVLNKEIIDLLVESRDRVGMLVKDLFKDKKENTGVADILERIGFLSGDGRIEESLSVLDEKNLDEKKDAVSLSASSARLRALIPNSCLISVLQISSASSYARAP